MFGLVTKREYKNLINDVNWVALALAEVNKQFIVFDNEMNTLKKELHGCQKALYSLIDKLNCDLALNDKNEPTVVKR